MIRQAVVKIIMGVATFAYAHTLAEVRAGIIQIQKETIESLQGALESRESASESRNHTTEAMKLTLETKDKLISVLRDDIALLKRKIEELEGLLAEEAKDGQRNNRLSGSRYDQLPGYLPPGSRGRGQA